MTKLIDGKFTFFALSALKQIYLSPNISGSQICKRTKGSRSTLYPLLRKYVEAGIMTVQLEHGDPSLLGRPLQKYYQLTDEGIKLTFRLLKALQL